MQDNAYVHLGLQSHDLKCLLIHGILEGSEPVPHSNT